MNNRLPNSHTTWKGIIETINRPLGFYCLALLIVESFLTIVLTFGNLEASLQVYGMWAGVGLFIFVVCVVSIFVWCRPTHLTFSELGSLVQMGKASFGTNIVEVQPEKMPKGEPSNRQED